MITRYLNKKAVIGTHCRDIEKPTKPYSKDRKHCVSIIKLVLNFPKHVVKRLYTHTILLSKSLLIL